MSDSKNYLEDVRDQYEDYPYPKRDPEDEKHRLFATAADPLDWINYYCYEGRKDYSAGFRVLVAGGGTGDSVIFLAEQLLEYNADIVYLDISTTSMAVARQRAKIRGLTNITWINESILNIPGLDLGMFDYINCTGVLHHLENPYEGLTALRSVLKDDGAMMLMLYATYGRTGIYHIQDIMRLVNRGVTSNPEKVDNCKRILNSLPPTNWMVANKGLYGAEISEFGDIGIYDLFLHTQDRSYTVPELYEFIESADLNILQLFASHEPRGNRLYDPLSYISDSGIRERVRKLPLKEQQTIAELLHGRINKHMFYVTPTIPKRPVLEDLDNIPFLSVAYNEQAYDYFHELVKNSHDTVEIQSREVKNKKIKFPKTRYTVDIFKYLDGKRSSREIFSEIINNHSGGEPPAEMDLLQELHNIFDAFNTQNWMLLRAKSVRPFTTIEDLQKNSINRQAGC